MKRTSAQDRTLGKPPEQEGTTPNVVCDADVQRDRGRTTRAAGVRPRRPQVARSECSAAARRAPVAPKNHSPVRRADARRIHFRPPIDEYLPMEPTSAAVTCTSCERTWNSASMAEGLRLLGACPRCGGELSFADAERDDPA